MAKPLTAHTKDGRPYTRRPMIETEIDEAIGRPIGELRRRLMASDEDPESLSSECILHLLRLAIDGRGFDCEGLLLERFMRRVERFVRPKTDRENAEALFQAVADDLSMRLTRRASTLDYYEVNFNAALMKTTLTHVRKLRRVLEAEGCSEPKCRLDAAPDDQENSTTKLDVVSALHTLSPIERKIFVLVEHLRFKVGSKNRTETTAATLCGLSARMVRKYLASAKRKLATALENYQP